MSNTNVPEGFMQNAQGHMVPLALIKPIDQERDKLVRELMAIVIEQNQGLTAAKKRIFGDVAAFVSLSAEQYGVKRGGVKGNVTLFSFDGSMKIQIATAENIKFDERLAAAQALVDECIRDWGKHSRPEIMAMVQQAFQTDKEGNLNVGRIMSLRRLDIKDQRWVDAMRAIGESVQVIGTKQYIRAYKRLGDSDRYEAIPLDMVTV